MKIRIILESSGGELDRLTLDAPDDRIDRAVWIHESIKAWNLDAGDTIRIEEVES